MNSIDKVVQETQAARQDTAPARRIVGTQTAGNSAPPKSVPASWYAYSNTVKPAVDSFMLQSSKILRAWTKDPIVMCCLIRNLAAIGSLDKIQRATKDPKTIEAIGMLHQIRALLDLVIGFLQKDIDGHLKSSTDLLGTIMLAVVGAVITTFELLQQYLKEEIFELMGKSRDSVFRRCWPFDALIDLIIKTITHPITGIFVKLNNYIKDWTNKIKADIGVKYNCSSLESADRELKELKRERDEYNAEINENINVEGQEAAIGELKTKEENARRAIIAIRSRIEVNKGVPILGQAGCYLRKVGVLQNLRFFRHIVDKIINGLDKGILCVNLTDETLVTSGNPLNVVSSVMSPLPKPGVGEIIPTDDEIANFLEIELGLDGEVITDILAGQDTVLTGQRDPDQAPDPDQDAKIIADLDGQIKAIETLADCTQVISDELIIEINDTLTRLER